jgi:hypothetical protein
VASARASAASDLYIADIATGKVTLLAKAMGFNMPADASSDATYLPFGSEDLHRNYYPTLSPTAAGGYFWVFFDSLRHFGSLGPVRVLWGAALDIRADGNYESRTAARPCINPSAARTPQPVTCVRTRSKRRHSRYASTPASY